MNEHSTDDPTEHAFARVCGEVLWRPPAGDPAQRSSVAHWRYLSSIGRYRMRLGNPPAWFEGCDASHRLRLCEAAISWNRRLPEHRPAPVRPVAGEEDRYEVSAVPVDLQVIRDQAPIEMHGAGPVISLQAVAENPGTLTALESALGAQRARCLISAMRDGEVNMSDRDLIEDFLLEGLSNSEDLAASFERRSRDVDGSEVAWPIEVYRFLGVYQVRSPETDPRGPFSSLEAAVGFILSNWDDAEPRPQAADE